MTKIAPFAVALLLAGCSSTTGGTPQSESSGTSTPSNATTTATTTVRPSVVPAATIKADLLKRSELAGIVGVAELSQVQTYTEPDSNVSAVEPFSCAFRLLAGSSYAYDVPSRLAMFGDANAGGNGVLAAQVVVAFTVPEKAGLFLQSTSSGWSSCPDGKPFAVTGPDAAKTVQQWTADEPLVSATRISTTVTRQGGPARTCSHVVAVDLNVGVDSVACGDGDTARQANAVADQILAKLPS